jgi:hypothetical protein
MPRNRSSKPWLHKPSGYWCSTINAKRVYLVDYRTACLKLNELRAKELRENAGGTEWIDVPFTTLVSEYLDDVQKRLKANTYNRCRYGRLLLAL